jgi:hypothetical protein
MSTEQLSAPPALPPASPPVGTPGHTADHITIASLLSWLEQAVTALQSAPASFALDGGNVATVPGGTTWATVTVQPGSTADVLDIYCGQQKIFSLNHYGEPRITAAATTETAEIIYALAAQSADVWQILSSSLAVLARVSPSGAASFAGPVSRQLPTGPAAWTHCTMANGWTAYAGRTLTVKLTNDNMVQISGEIVPGTVSDGIAVASLPSGYAPVRPEPIWVGQHNAISGSNGYTGPYLEAQPGGNLLLYSFGPYTSLGSPHLVIAGRFPLDAS